jgi:electron transfer flavoprotein alpha subunit
MIPSKYGPDEARGVWLYLEQEGGSLLGVTRELLGQGRELADSLAASLTGLLLGDSVAHLADQAIAEGADEVLVAEHSLLGFYTTDAHAKVVTEAVLEGKPDILLLGATTNGRDLAGRLAVRLRTGLTADCTDLTIEPETRLLLGQVVGFGGGVVATIKCENHRPQMATARPGVFPLPASSSARQGTVRQLDVSLSQEEVRVKVQERETQDESAITGAELLVVGGRGVGSDFSLLKELARLMGAEVGATRVAVDNGWATHEQQIGQTGYITRPKLAIVLGASGALQFTVGIEPAEMVVAINADEEAPIFEAADYYSVDDLFSLLPPLIREMKSTRGGVEGGGS